ncbi:hypothetical protein [Streptomyces sp. NPDC001348]
MGSTDGPAVAAGTGSGVATVSRPVNVTLANLRIQPGRIEVTKGTGLKPKATNKDAQRHDLKVGGGPTTPLLSRGESRTLDLGQVTRNRTAWCTLPGHRAAGMTLDTVVKTGSGETTAGHDGQMSMAAGSGGLDLAAAFSHGRKSRDASLAPVAGGAVHRMPGPSGPQGGTDGPRHASV